MIGTRVVRYPDPLGLTQVELREAALVGLLVGRVAVSVVR